MLRLLNRKLFKGKQCCLLFVSACAIIAASCEFADLRTINVSVTPDTSDVILSDYKSPVSVNFDTAMKKKETESMLSVTYYDGHVEGDMYWKDNSLVFVPVKGWLPGVRYALNISGVAYAVDGREIYLSFFVTFFAVNNSEAPYIINYEPADGASVGVTKETGACLHFVFSQGMNRRSVEDSFTINGFTGKEFSWNEGSTELFVTSKEKQNAWTAFSWKVGKDSLSCEGVPIVKETSGQFITDIDIKIPKVENVFPVLKMENENSGYNWIPSGLEIADGLGPFQGIAVEFSKSMDPVSVNGCIKFEPPLSGTVDIIAPNTIVFIPTGFPASEVHYKLIVSAGTKDMFGLKIENEYKTEFVPDIPFLKIEKFKFQGTRDTVILEDDINNEGYYSVYVSSVLKKVLCEIVFSVPITTIQEKADIVRNIRFETFFPSSLSAVALTNAYWLPYGTNKVLHLEWEGLLAGSLQNPNYYKLYIPGGTSGVSNGEGSYLRDSLTIYLEAKNE
ncbi:MAG: hypothetical protein LBV52_06915 [Spirochaetaceae bacterium]|jgi:hypothetical protein|nr:hypothetical protein [Spirochaetaceae bacterium]